MAEHLADDAAAIAKRLKEIKEEAEKAQKEAQRKATTVHPDWVEF